MLRDVQISVFIQQEKVAAEAFFWGGMNWLNHRDMLESESDDQVWSVRYGLRSVLTSEFINVSFASNLKSWPCLGFERSIRL